MELINGILQTLFAYLRELFFPVLLGFLFSGIIHEFISERLVRKYFGNGSMGSVFAATLIGVILPVCCVGSLPIAVTFRQKGARLGPILAFLIATPATSVPALLVSWKFMGLTYTVFMTIAVIVMGLSMGFIGNILKAPENKGSAHVSNCCNKNGHDREQDVKSRSIGARIMNVFYYAWIELPRKIGLEILIGAVVASVIISFDVVREFVRAQLSGFKGYLILVVIGFFDYVCSTASIPVANALAQSGVSLGKSMVYLLMGPITSYATILVIRKEFGMKTLAVYLLIISVGSITAGWFYDLFFGSNFMG